MNKKKINIKNISVNNNDLYNIKEFVSKMLIC